jgi:hypothetical protein
MGREVMGGEVVPGLDEDSGRLPIRVRATQTLTSHMSFCWEHPSLTTIEVGWRWLFGVPFLAVMWVEAQWILARIPPSSVGLDRLNFQNPWISSVMLADAVGVYSPAVANRLTWIGPVLVLGWAIASGLGRTLILWRLDRLDSPGLERPLGYFQSRIPGVIVLQGLWLLALLGCFWLWYRGVSWAAGAHLTSVAEPELVGYLCWLIFLTLGFLVLWATVSWTLAMAPLIHVLERASIWGALTRSFRLGSVLSGKLVEVNLVMAIVKIALIVLAMVFSAAPLPFSDEFGPDFMHVLYVVIAVGFLIANDYFHVVRLRSYLALRRVYRASYTAVLG